MRLPVSDQQQPWSYLAPFRSTPWLKGRCTDNSPLDKCSNGHVPSDKRPQDMCPGLVTIPDNRFPLESSRKNSQVLNVFRRPMRLTAHPAPLEGENVLKFNEKNNFYAEF